MGQTEHTTPIRINLTGGFKFCGDTPFAPIGVMSEGSRDYVQREDGLYSRLIPETIYPFGVGGNYQAFSAYLVTRIIAQLTWRGTQNFPTPARDPIVRPIILNISYFNSYLCGEESRDNFRSERIYLAIIKFLYNINSAHADNYPPAAGLAALVFSDQFLTRTNADWERWGVHIIHVVGNLSPAEVLYWRTVFAFPSVSVGFFERFFIFSFPNYFITSGRGWNTDPCFLWIRQNNQADELIYYFVASTVARLSRLKMPTMFTLYHVKNSPAQVIIWALAPTNHVRVTAPLTDVSTANPGAVSRLLTNTPNGDAYNWVLNIASPDGSFFNKAIAEFNGSIFLWSEISCIIFQQVMILSPNAPHDPEFAPQYSLAPFRGGALSQNSICRAWNEIYVGDGEGRICAVTRIIASGSYDQADILKSVRLDRDIHFTFSNMEPDFPTPSGCPQKILQIEYSKEEDVLYAYFYWQKRNLGGQLGWDNYLLLYNKYVPKDSTGWSLGSTPEGIPLSFWTTPVSSVFVADALVAIEKGIYTYGALCPPVSNGFFVRGNPIHFAPMYTSPFFVLPEGQIMFLLRAISFSLERLSVAPLKLHVSVLTDTDLQKRSIEYLAKASFVFGEGRLGADRLSTLTSRNSFMVGMKGVAARFTIRSLLLTDVRRVIVPPPPHVLSSVLLWVKPVGGLLYEEPLEDMGI